MIDESDKWLAVSAPDDMMMKSDDKHSANIVNEH
jgi:hypothetical protein